MSEGCNLSWNKVTEWLNEVFLINKSAIITQIIDGQKDAYSVL